MDGNPGREAQPSCQKSAEGIVVSTRDIFDGESRDLVGSYFRFPAVISELSGVALLADSKKLDSLRTPVEK